MANKVIQMLSPENYIRNKVRTLPIYECLVNSNWEKSKMVHVVIARRHTNGNITACFYLKFCFIQEITFSFISSEKRL